MTTALKDKLFDANIVKIWQQLHKWQRYKDISLLDIWPTNNLMVENLVILHMIFRFCKKVRQEVSRTLVSALYLWYGVDSVSMFVFLQYYWGRGPRVRKGGHLAIQFSSWVSDASHIITSFLYDNASKGKYVLRQIIRVDRYLEWVGSSQSLLA